MRTISSPSSVSSTAPVALPVPVSEIDPTQVLSYADAQRWSAANSGCTVVWECGEGWKAEGRYCTKRRKLVRDWSINPEGWRL